MSLLALALAYAGFAALALATDRPHRMISGRPPSRSSTAALRAAGFALLGVALVPSMDGLEGSTGVVAWFGFLTSAALALVFLLPYAPRAAVSLAAIAPMVAAIVAFSEF